METTFQAQLQKLAKFDQNEEMVSTLLELLNEMVALFENKEENEFMI